MTAATVATTTTASAVVIRMRLSAMGERLPSLAPLSRRNLAELAGVPEARRVEHVLGVTRVRLGQLRDLDYGEPFVRAALLEDRAGQPSPSATVLVVGSARRVPDQDRRLIGETVAALVVGVVHGAPL